MLILRPGKSLDLPTVQRAWCRKLKTAWKEPCESKFQSSLRPKQLWPNDPFPFEIFLSPLLRLCCHVCWCVNQNCLQYNLLSSVVRGTVSVCTSVRFNLSSRKFLLVRFNLSSRKLLSVRFNLSSRKLLSVRFNLSSKKRLSVRFNLSSRQPLSVRFLLSSRKLLSFLLLLLLFLYYFLTSVVRSLCRFVFSSVVGSLCLFLKYILFLF